LLRFAVVGNPVSHSKSPLIHALFAAQTGKQLQYTREQVEVDEFAGFVRKFFAAGGAGLNVTVPFKEMAYALAEHHGQAAQRARAVNTLYLDHRGRLWGDNTDGIGLVRDLRDNHRVILEGKRILVMGAGGAVRGVLASLAENEPTSITLVNRTVARAKALQREFRDLVDFEVISFQDHVAIPYQLIINGTSSGLRDEVPPLSPQLLGRDCCCYDMLYGSADTAFVRWARQQGAALALDGLGMLVEQAAESFNIWLGIRPQTAAVIAKVRASLA
jgi:shikimate dehydrogenase